MRLLSFLNTAMVLALAGSGFAQADDLDKIDPPLVKEPAYQSKTPRYALLVFGPEARTRIWLVLDGTTLYVDRNGNGDLTEAGEKVTGKKGDSWSWGDTDYTFAVGELRDGERRHRNFTLTVTGSGAAAESRSAAGSGSNARSFRLHMDAEIPGFHGTGEDGRVLQMADTTDPNGSLQFANRPKNAPILHFAGPWTISLSERATFRVGREMELYLALTTPGRGPGTKVYTAYEGLIPAAFYPRVEASFPAQKPGEPPVKAVYELKGRCCTVNLHGPVRVPANVGTGATLVKLSFDSWTTGKVRASELEVRTVSPRSGPAPLPVSPRLTRRLVHPDHDKQVYATLFSPDGRIILAHSLNSARVQVWNAQTGEQVRTLQLPRSSTGPGRIIQSGARTLAPDGRTLYVPFATHQSTLVSKDGKPGRRYEAVEGEIMRWDVESGRQHEPKPLIAPRRTRRRTRRHGHSQEAEEGTSREKKRS